MYFLIFIFLIGSFEARATVNDDRSIQHHSFPKDVKVSVYIQQLQKIDAESFTGAIEYRFIWRDDRIVDKYAFATELIGNEASHYLSNNWHPNLRFNNLISEKNNEWQKIIIKPRGHVELIWNFSGEYQLQRDFANFPFDKINLQLMIQSSLFSKDRVTFSFNREDTQLTGISEKVGVDNWELGEIKNSHRSVDFGSASKSSIIKFELLAKRKWWHYFSVVFVPFFAIMLLPLIVFWLPEGDLTSKVRAIVSSLLALVAFNFSLNLFSRSDIGSTSALAIMLGVGYLYIILVVAALMTVANPVVRDKLVDKYLAKEIYAFLRWATPLSFTAIVVCIILIAQT